MKNLLSRLSTRKWLFAVSMYFIMYCSEVWQIYGHEVEAIKQKSLQHFGVDIAPNLGFFEILKSADFHFFKMLLFMFILVFIPSLLIALMFFDYKNEAHAGWQRVFISAQLVIPLIALINFLMFGSFGDFLTFVWLEFIVLVLIKLFIWVRDGFTQAS